jgi:hypothetical protein
MSTLATTNIKHPSSASNNIVLDASGNVNIDSNTLYVDATNNRVGIGVASPLGRLDSSWGWLRNIPGASLNDRREHQRQHQPYQQYAKNGAYFWPHYDNGTDIGFIRFDSASTVTELQLGGTAEKRGATNISFYTATTNTATPSERVRINNTGTLSVYGPADNPSVNFSVSHGPGTHQSLAIYSGGSGTTSLGTKQFFVQNNGDVRNTNNSYGAISDVKLKENIVNASSQWSDIKALQVRKYNLKEETGHQTHTQIGLVAQEAELVSPGLVSESPDRDAEGNDLGTVTKSVNYSVLYMKAVKALQEAMERIEQLETSNADLLDRVTALESA